MDWYFVVLIVVGVVLFFLLFPLFIQVRFYVNALKNLSAVNVTLLWIIPLFSVRLKLSKDAIKIITKNRKEKEIKFISPKAVLMFEISKNILQKLKIFQIYLFFYVGKKDDAMATAMLSGYLITLIHLFFVFIHNTKGDIVSNFVCDKDFENSKLKSSGYTSIFILPLTILVCILKSVIKLKQQQKVKRRT